MRSSVKYFLVSVFLLVVVSTTAFGQIIWRCTYEEAPAVAQNRNKPIVLYFMSSDNPACRELEATFLSNKSISTRLNSDYVKVRIDIRNRPVLARKYRIVKTPVIVFLDTNANEILRVISFKNVARFGKLLDFVTSVTTEQPRVSLESAPAASPTPSPQPSSRSVLPLDQINSTHLDSTVTVKGTIVNAVSPSSDTAPYSYYINDGTETMRVVIFPSVFKHMENTDKLELDTDIIATGKVQEYYNKLEIHVQSPENMTLASTASSSRQVAEEPSRPAPQTSTSSGGGGTTPISSITPSMKSQQVRVRGEVTNVKPSWKPTAPTTVTIQDQGGSIDVVYWHDVEKQLSPNQRPRVGATMEASGEVDEFQGRLQVKVDSPRDSVVEGIAALPTPLSGKVDIRSITRNNIGQRVTISGTITRAYSVSGGTLLTVTDNTGNITVPLWDAVAQKLADMSLLEEGTEVTISGTIVLYEPRQELQIQVASPEDVIFKAD